MQGKRKSVDVSLRQFTGFCTGAQWRELPEHFGKWNSVFKRYARSNGVWADMFKQFAQDPDMAAVMPEVLLCAPICVCGRVQKRGRQREQGLGRSRGGFSSKIHSPR